MVENHSSITFPKLQENIVIHERSEWFHPDTPVLQIPTPYVFKSASLCFINQTHPMELIGSGQPFRLIEGRFPIHSWLRPLAWAIEWTNIQEDISIRRGQPWFDVFFELENPELRPKLIKRNISSMDKKRLLHSKDVTGYISGTKLLWR